MPFDSVQSELKLIPSWVAPSLSRQIFSHFRGAGLDLFTNPQAVNPGTFSVLNNVMPATDGGFNRRWALSTVDDLGTLVPNYLSLYSYSAKRDQSWTGTADTSLILGANTDSLTVLHNEFGTPLAVSSYTFPGLATPTARVRGVGSRSFFYFTLGADSGEYASPNPPKKIPFFQTTKNLTQNWGIAPAGESVYAPVFSNSMSSNTTAVPISTIGVDYSSQYNPPHEADPEYRALIVVTVGAHGLNVGDPVTIAGNSVASYNRGLTGVGKVLSSNSFIISYGYGPDNGTGTGGTATGSNVSIVNSTVTPGTNAVYYFKAIGSTGSSSSPSPTLSLSTSAGTGGAVVGTVTGRNILFVAVVTPGSGFTSTPSGAATGPGTGASFNVHLNSTGGIGYIEIVNGGQGYDATTTFAVSGGGGSGATFAVLTNNPNYGLTAIYPSTSGSGYLNDPDILLNGVIVGGTTVTIASSGSGGGITGAYCAGPMSFVEGRTYTFAWKNSVTGHVGDIFYAPCLAAAPKTGTGLGGWSQITVGLVAAIPNDPQIDQCVLLATGDAGDLKHLYEAITITLTPAQIASGVLVLQYIDTVPDTVSQTYLTGPTLLTQNLYVDESPSGITVGIAGNQPPAANLTCPTLYGGRMWMTDGVAVYASKSIDEVTTSTGLITSKWEEAWPGNEIDIASGNERIPGMLSDGVSLYVGTTGNVYRLTGNTLSTLEVEVAFHKVGVMSNELWSIIYQENIPTGMVWMTPDRRVIFSNFNSYNDVGDAIQPLLNAIDPVSLSSASFQSVSYGQYSFAALNVTIAGTPMLLIYDTKNNAWFTWTAPTNLYSGPFPMLTYVDAKGLSKLYVVSAINALNNGGFESNAIGTPLNTSRAVGQTVGDGWIVSVLDGASFAVQLESVNGAYSGANNLGLSIAPAQTIPPNTTYSCRVLSTSHIAVNSATTLNYSCYAGVASSVGRLTGINVRQRIGVYFYDGGGTLIGSEDYVETVNALSNYTLLLRNGLIVPAGAVYAQIELGGFVQNITGSPITLPNGLVADMRFDDVVAPTAHSYLQVFDPVNSVADQNLGSSAVTNIPWAITTAWQDFSDPLAYKVLNELEVWTGEATTSATVQSANTIADFTSPFTVRSGLLTPSPLGASKLYLAGSRSKGRYFNFSFGSNTPGTASRVLSAFAVELFPMSRF